MASTQDFVQYVCGQADGVTGLTYRKMFGEYAVYLHGKVIALVCDDQLYVKPTNAGRALLGQPVEKPPFPGANMYFLIDEHLEDRALLGELLRATERELPAKKAKTPKKRRGRGR